MEVRVIEQDLISYMGQLEFANIPVEGWITDTDVCGLLDGSCDVVCLCTHNLEVVHPGVVICSVGIVIDGERCLDMSLEPFPKGPCRFPYVLLITLQPITLVPVNYSIPLCDVIPILGSHQQVFDGVVFLEVDLDPNFARNVHEVSLEPFVYGTTIWMLMWLLLLLWLLVFFGTDWYCICGCCWFGVYLRPKRDTYTLVRAFLYVHLLCVVVSIDTDSPSLCIRVLTTLYFAAGLWWLSHWMY